MARIPSFSCKPGCSRCCGLVPFTTQEKAAATEKHPLIAWTKFGDGAWVPTKALDDFTCPFLRDHQCSIYSVRPTICRLFGAVDHPNLDCPEGCGPEVKISNQEASQILTAAGV